MPRRRRGASREDTHPAVVGPRRSEAAGPAQFYSMAVGCVREVSVPATSQHPLSPTPTNAFPQVRALEPTSANVPNHARVVRDVLRHLMAAPR